MKIKRHSKIIELINEFDIETQEELAAKLAKSGFDVTQSTVSRDIRELSLMKVPTPSGKQKYAVMAPTEHTEKLVRIFRDGVISIDVAQNIVVLKTLVGMAMAVAASLDAMNFTHIMGTIAGDDTIFCLVKTQEKALELLKKLKQLQKNNSL